jgi:hypothetical protein
MSKLSVYGMALLALLAVVGRADAARAPRIEVAFALDATGSMGPYITQARQRIHQIAQSLAEGHPKPDVRFAVVAYRDKGDEFVQRIHPFTRDLSVMHGYLKGTAATGGGDTPEAVLEALRAAITELGWSQASDKGVVRLLYLVGDAPAQHYSDSPSEGWIAREARKRRIVIHSIACGRDTALEPTFEGLSRHTEGRFFRLADSAARVARAGLRGSSSTLAETVTDSVRAYSSSVGVAYDSSEGQPIETTPLAKVGPRGVAASSGLRGAHVRWARDGQSFHALWTAHMSQTPTRERLPVPEIDFARHHVLVIGGSDAGLGLVGVERRGKQRVVRVKPTDKPGVTFVLVPAEPEA